MKILGADYFEGKINGLKVRDLIVNVDDRGTLVELLRTDFAEVYDTLFRKDSENVHQIYLVQNHNDSVRAFHKHSKLVDFFCIIHGVAKFIFFDDRKDSSTYKYRQIINVTDKRLQMICVPTGVFHGWKADKGTILISVANELYMGKDKKGVLDEERIPWDTFGKEVWETQNK